jgi:hypothetical protein
MTAFVADRNIDLNEVGGFEASDRFHSMLDLGVD